MMHMLDVLPGCLLDCPLICLSDYLLGESCLYYSSEKARLEQFIYASCMNGNRYEEQTTTFNVTTASV